eukprot:4027033-Amphidinium_carterae.1
MCQSVICAAFVCLLVATCVPLGHCLVFVEERVACALCSAAGGRINDSRQFCGLQTHVDDLLMWLAAHR